MRVSSAGLMDGTALTAGKGEPELGLAVRLADSGRLTTSSLPCGRLRTAGLRSMFVVRGVLAGRRPRDGLRYGNMGICDAGDLGLEPKCPFVDDDAGAWAPGFHLRRGRGDHSAMSE